MAKLLAINPARALLGERLAAAVNLNPAVKQYMRRNKAYLGPKTRPGRDSSLRTSICVSRVFQTVRSKVGTKAVVFIEIFLC